MKKKQTQRLARKFHKRNIDKNTHTHNLRVDISSCCRVTSPKLSKKKYLFFLCFYFSIFKENEQKKNTQYKRGKKKKQISMCEFSKKNVIIKKKKIVQPFRIHTVYYCI